MRRLAFFVLLGLFLQACASSFEAPSQIDADQFRARATTKTTDNIRVSAMIPGEEESKSIFGVDLWQHDIQPFWLEIENGTDREFVLLPTGLDPEYFDPLEVAYLYEDDLTENGHTELAEHIISVSFDSRRKILPGETVSGFLYVYQTHTSLMAEIDLLGSKWSRRISMLVPVESIDEPQERVRALRRLYATDEIVEINDEPILRKALEELPCCATDQDEIQFKYPLNLILIGEVEEVGPAFGRRLYRHNPVHASYVFGRMEDLSGRKISRWVEPQPHQVSLWLTPLRFHGKPIWIGQVTTRLGGRFGNPDNENFRMDPDVDDARNDLVQDLLYSQTISRLGFVNGAKCQEPTVAGQGAEEPVCHTDGLRAVMLFGTDEVSLSQIDIFDWESLIER